MIQKEKNQSQSWEPAMIPLNFDAFPPPRISQLLNFFQAMAVYGFYYALYLYYLGLSHTNNFSKMFLI